MVVPGGLGRTKSVVPDPTRTLASREPEGTRFRSDDRLPAPLQPRDPARYQILAEHGRGGLGRVYRARDRELGREVAIKELLDPPHRSELRFFREALITARLDHPGIVPVHEAGRWPDGSPFYTMKLVAGRPLAEILAATETFDQRLALVPHLIAVADAIAYAHDRQIIHRDLKPSNVIIGDFGETFVIDWGLAKELTEAGDEDAFEGPYRTPAAPEVTVAGSVLGTPAYMSPEQARGDEVDKRSDVYALGAMLHQLCTGARRGDDSTGDALARELRAVPRDLAAIILKCLAAGPEDRYADASDLAADLRCFMSGRLVSAHRYSAPARLGKWVARHRSLVTAAAIAALILVAVSTASILRIVRERDIADLERRRAQRERNAVVLTHARESLAADPTTAVAWLKKLPEGTDLDGVVGSVAMDAGSRGVARKVLRFSSSVEEVAASDDGQTLVVATRDGTFRRYQMPGPTLVAEAHASVGCEISMTAGGGIVALTQENGDIALWYRSGAVAEVPGHTRAPFVTAFAPGGGALYSAGPDGQVRVVDVAARRSSLLYRQADVITGIAVSARGERIATASADGSVVLFDLATARARRLDPFPGQHVAAVDVHFLGDGRLVSGHSNGELLLWTADGRIGRHVKVHNGGVDHLRVARDSSTVLSVGTDRTIARVAMADLSVETLGTDASPITNSVLGHIAGRSLFVVTFADGSLRYWDLEAHLSRELEGHDRLVPAAALVAGEGGQPLIASAGHDRTLRLWPVPPPISRVLHAHTGGVLAVRASPDGVHVATAGRDGRIVVASLSGVDADLRGDRDAVYDLSFSTDGRLIASAGWSRTVTVWDVARRLPIAARSIPGDLPGNLVFLESGRLLLVASASVFEWDHVKDELRVLRTFDEPVDQMALRRRAGPLLVLTRSGRLHRLDLDTSRWTEEATRAVRLLGRGHVLEVPHAGERGVVRVVDPVAGVAYGPVRLPFEVEASLLDADRRVLFAFDHAGRGLAWYLVGGEVVQMRSVNDATRGLAQLPGGAVLRLVEDGALERWDFHDRTLAVVRDHDESSTGALAVLPVGSGVVTAAMDGRVFGWHLDLLDRRWARLRSTSLESLTDLTVDDIVP